MSECKKCANFVPTFPLNETDLARERGKLMRVYDVCIVCIVCVGGVCPVCMMCVLCVWCVWGV